MSMVSLTAKAIHFLTTRSLTSSSIRRMSTTTETAFKRKEAEEESSCEENKKRWRRESDEDLLDTKYCETEYYFDGYLRKVYPYYYTYKSFCKRRWIGRKLSEVLSHEFRVLKEGQLEYKFKVGDVRVNESLVDIDYVLKDLDRISSRVHRHELPVLSTSIKVVHEDDNYVVINKPPSLPVHPCGRYRFNSTIALLYKEYGYKKLYIAHRLDRLTSGLLILSKNVQTAAKLAEEITSRTVCKQYVCRVEGDFRVNDQEKVIVDKKLKIICKKIGLSVVTEDDDNQGKESTTEFEKLSFNGKSSLVLCKPKTGRTHQIRVHLQFLGYPIVNDPLYNSTAFGPKKGKDGDYNGMTMDELIKELRKHHDVGDWIERSQEGNIIGISEDYVDPEEHDSTLAYLQDIDFVKKESTFDPTKVALDPFCPECDVRYMNPKAKHLMLFLHALSYSGQGWSFKTDMPFWAKDDYTAL